MSEAWVPELHSELTYKYSLVGHENTPVLIIDNFLRDAHWLVEFCKRNNDLSAVDNFYPGHRMVAPKLYIHAINNFLAELLKNIFELPQENIAGGKALYSLVLTPPELLEIAQCLPHVDSYLAGDLACVHYLCGSDKGGTSFYRHKKTGYEKLTSANVDSYRRSVVEEGAFALQKKTYMNGSNCYFEQIASVDAMFNRMVVYPSNILHSGNIAPDFQFDPNPETGRLTLNSFIFCKRD